MNKIMLIAISVIAFLGLSVLFMYMSYSNAEVKLRNRAVAQEKVCEANFDKMWKVIKQKAGVTEQYKDGFRDIYVDLIRGRYANTDSSGTVKQSDNLMKWIQESNPVFDVSLYKDLMVAIEAQREAFFDEQKTLIDIKMQHDNCLNTFPSSLFVGSRPVIEIKIITSETTEEVYSTGQENNIELFK
jgi:uncharacterized protein YqiB (DUF1249 family)